MEDLASFRFWVVYVLLHLLLLLLLLFNDESYLVMKVIMKVIIVKEVISCDVLPVAMFVNMVNVLLQCFKMKTSFWPSPLRYI